MLIDELAVTGSSSAVRMPPIDGSRLHLTVAGRGPVTGFGQVCREHDQSFCAALTEHESAQRGELLQKLANVPGLRQHVHHGYCKLHQSPDARVGGKS